MSNTPSFREELISQTRPDRFPRNDLRLESRSAHGLWSTQVMMKPVRSERKSTQVTMKPVRSERKSTQVTMKPVRS